ncbi:Os10g0579400, partial [Oryza sativa Japonica Group]
FWQSSADQGDLSDVVRASLQLQTAPRHQAASPPYVHLLGGGGAGRARRRRWCASRRGRVAAAAARWCRRTCGRGGSTGRSPSRGRPTLAGTTAAAAPKVAPPGSRWSAAAPTPQCSSSPTPPTTTIHGQPTATPSPAPPAPPPPTHPTYASKTVLQFIIRVRLATIVLRPLTSSRRT